MNMQTNKQTIICLYTWQAICSTVDGNDTKWERELRGVSVETKGGLGGAQTGRWHQHTFYMSSSLLLQSYYLLNNAHYYSHITAQCTLLQPYYCTMHTLPLRAGVLFKYAKLQAAILQEWNIKMAGWGPVLAHGNGQSSCWSQKLDGLDLIKLNK